ncbi:MAG: amidohydrolase family protein [Chloroflexi bacterium]|nr:amidohydrolase family protein [Chloroflexota bacterium]
MVTGDLAHPLADADSLYIEDGVIRELGTGRVSAEVEIDARGLTLVPGLVDGHTHPTFGDFSPTQNSVGWTQAYLHGGTTTIVSAGELHLPGLPLDKPDPKLWRYLAVLARRCTADYRPGGLKIVAGTMCLMPGMVEADFDELAAEGSRVVKFIFYPYGERPEEAQAYVDWAKKRGLVVKIHSGGVSRSGLSRPAGAAVITTLRPDVVGHASGGPIPMPLEELDEVVERTDAFLEVAYAGNPRWTVHLVQKVRERNELHRLTVGTDTPSGTGTTPRGMLRTIALMASLGGVSAPEALCLASGNTARAHGLQTGFIRPGSPADLLLIGRIVGANGRDVLEALSVGDLPGISAILVDGQVLVAPRSQQMPPPERLAVVTTS